MPEPMGEHAIVIGAGIGGLAAAGALAGYFEHVTVLERDALPSGAHARPGAPQSNHPHALLTGGLRALCELFPGFDQDLVGAGGVPLRGGLDFRDELPAFHPFPQRDLGWVSYSMSRPLIELIVRRRVQQMPDITVRGRCRALDIVAADDGSVAAVRCETPDGAHEMQPISLSMRPVAASSRFLFSKALTGLNPRKPKSASTSTMQPLLSRFRRASGTGNW
jgi:2-polyprenyl-6-methoxyphenol hydroxylase-like FAD-dependent oxidoreductase